MDYIFYADGVKLNLKGSVIEDYLRELEKRGAKILTCTTCLNYFKLKNELFSGFTAGMPDLVNAIAKAEKVISI